MICHVGFHVGWPSIWFIRSSCRRSGNLLLLSYKNKLLMRLLDFYISLVLEPSIKTSYTTNIWTMCSYYGLLETCSTSLENLQNILLWHLCIILSLTQDDCLERIYTKVVLRTINFRSQMVFTHLWPMTSCFTNSVAKKWVHAICLHINLPTNRTTHVQGGGVHLFPRYKKHLFSTHGVRLACQSRSKTFSKLPETLQRVSKASQRKPTHVVIDMTIGVEDLIELILILQNF